jgi:hypothetical protein
MEALPLNFGVSASSGDRTVIQRGLLRMCGAPGMIRTHDLLVRSHRKVRRRINSLHCGSFCGKGVAISSSFLGYEPNGQMALINHRLMP